MEKSWIRSHFYLQSKQEMFYQHSSSTVALAEEAVVWVSEMMSINRSHRVRSGAWWKDALHRKRFLKRWGQAGSPPETTDLEVNEL